MVFVLYPHRLRDEAARDCVAEPEPAVLLELRPERALVESGLHARDAGACSRIRQLGVLCLRSARTQ